LQFCNINRFVAISDETLLFCPLLDDLILSRRGVARQERWSYSTWFGKCPIHYAHFQLYDVLRFNSTVFINVLINTSSPKLNNQIS